MFGNWKRKRNIWINNLLRRWAREVLDKHQPLIIAITGSFGKTQTKDFTAEILKKKYPHLLKTKGSQNFKGVPATILRIPLTSSYKRLIKRLPKILWERWFSRSYPDLLILELGITHPGKLKRLVKFVKPKIGIVTGVGPSHLEFLKTLDRVAEEKAWLPRLLPSQGVAILNFDDPRVKAMAQKTKAKVISYGLNKESKVRAEEVTVSLSGMDFKFVFEKKKKEINIPNLINKHHIYSVLASSACGLICGISFEEIVKILPHLKTLEGRGNLIQGIKNSLIINDSYNSNPASCSAALKNLKELGKNKRKMAILGDMLEQGDYTEEGHRKIGKLATETVDYLVGVGPASRFILKEAAKRGMSSKKMTWYEDSELVAQDLMEKIEKGDIILIKGSRALEMEKIVEKLRVDNFNKSDMISHIRRFKT